MFPSFHFVLHYTCTKMLSFGWKILFISNQLTEKGNIFFITPFLLKYWKAIFFTVTVPIIFCNANGWLIFARFCSISTRWIYMKKAWPETENPRSLRKDEFLLKFSIIFKNITKTCFHIWSYFEDSPFSDIIFQENPIYLHSSYLISLHSYWNPKWSTCWIMKNIMLSRFPTSALTNML